MTLAILQTTMNLQKHLMNYAKTMDDVKRFLRVDYKEWLKTKDRIVGELPICPECSSKLIPMEVNTSPRNQVGEDYTIQWVCGKANCEHERFSKEDIKRWESPNLYKTEMGKILGAFSLDDLEKAIEIIEKVGDSTKEWKGKAIKCPDCGHTMRLFSISHDECHWVCQKCRFGIYKPHSKEREIKEIGFK